MKPPSLAPFPRLFSFSRLDSPCCWCKSEDFAATGKGGCSAISPVTVAVGKTDRTQCQIASKKHIQVPRPLPRQQTSDGRTRNGGRRKKTGKKINPEADEQKPRPILGSSCPQEPMRDAHQCSRTGFEDFEGSVIVRWKVLLSPKCRKKTSKCPRRQAR